MGYREFVDDGERLWKVWDVVPDQRIFLKRRTPPGSRLPRASAESELTGTDFTPSREQGWLAFQSPAENRRLSPIPTGWEDATDAELRRYLERATPVKNRYRA